MKAYRLLCAMADPREVERVCQFADDAEAVIVDSAARCLASLAEASFDVVVLDHALPGGFDVLAQLRAAGQPLAIVMLTAERDDAMALRAIDLGATDFLPKTTDYVAALRTRICSARVRISDARFRSLFEHSPVCLWEEDGSELKGHLDQLRARGVIDMPAYLREHPSEVARCMAMVKVLDVNQASLDLYEAPSKAALITGLARTFTVESHPVIAGVIAALADGRTMFEAETTCLTFAGRTAHVSMRTHVAPGREATLSRIYVSMVDITARKLAEDQAQMLAMFPQLNPTSVLRLAADGSITYANPAALSMAQALGHDIGQLLPDETTTIVREVLATGRVMPVETRPGARTLAWSFHPVTSHDVVHCYALDVTERLQLEEQLRQSQKMDAIGHLAGGIAHDFNNLLTVICAHTALLQRVGPSAGLDAIANAADRAADLVRQLLAFGRRQVLQARELDLNLTLGALFKLLARVVREDVEVRLELADEPVYTRADEGLVDQLLMNLIVNARDAMPDGGTLVLATSKVWLDDDELRAGLELPSGPYACVRVRDTGTGIAPEHLPRLFEPFFTTKEPGKGTGLGLATAFGIVKQHGGAIAVASEPGRGTTFAIYLPWVAGRAAEPPAPVASVVTQPTGGAETILLVEDEEPVRRLVQYVLEANGYRVEPARSGAEALAMIATGIQFELVLTDMVMPGGVSGRDLAEQLRTTRPDAKIIFMSGYTGELELSAGAKFLQKPFSPALLLTCIRDLLDGSRALGALAHSPTLG
ncbi:MAG: response regulator [Proteobacteria bacterium]|nr:response regulator [Pseudomonadota bacterium]